MENINNNMKDGHRFPVKRYTSVLLIVWTIIILFSLSLNISEEREQVISYARIHAASLFEKDILYRRWNTEIGGVYAAVTEKTPPNPYLEGVIKERDIITLSGKKLTLINPAYMTRQVHELGMDADGVLGHITSLKPIRPENAADPWETEALTAFEEGEKEVGSLEMIDGKEYFRFMRPLITEKGCLRCHERQGYKVGDIRGGISISVPMAAHKAILAGHEHTYYIEHFLMWLFGVVLIILGSVWISLNDRTRRKAEKNLSDSENKYRTLFEKSADAILMIEGDKFVDCNTATVKMLGYKNKKELLETHPSQLSPQTQPDGRSSFEKANEMMSIAFEQGSNRFEWDHKRQNGEVFPVEVLLTTVPIGDREFLHVVWRDITDRKEAEDERESLLKELEAKNKELEQMVYISSHDLRTPLVNISGYSGELGKALDILLSKISSGEVSCRFDGKERRLIEDMPESLEYISNSALKMNSLLDGLLQYSRLGRTELKKERLDMNSIMSETIQSFKFKLGKLGVRLDLSELPECIGDGEKIGQVFSNLIGNALKYLDPKQMGVIKISGRTEDGMSLYCVEDNGIGIATDYKEKIFDIFQQLEPSIIGEGLGLTIVKKIVERHCGKVWVDSEEGKGSRFFVSLPQKTIMN